jgi:transcriptional regulator with XRE-family HTH domain
MKANARKRLAHRVRLLRTNRGWSQEVLAELSGMNRSYIGAIERAEHNIGLDNIERLSAALETSVYDLIDGQAQTEHQIPTAESSLRVVASQRVIIHRNVFLELLNQCAGTHNELVLIYLQRCGVTVCD